jgi:hypothetical protein
MYWENDTLSGMNFRLTLPERIALRAVLVEHRAVVGLDLRLGHKGVGDGEHRGQQKGHREGSAQKEHDEPAEITLFPHPSTSFPKLSSA